MLPKFEIVTLHCVIFDFVKIFAKKIDEKLAI
jgi:hypothetical protein